MSVKVGNHRYGNRGIAIVTTTEGREEGKEEGSVSSADSWRKWKGMMIMGLLLTYGIGQL